MCARVCVRVRVCVYTCVYVYTCSGVGIKCPFPIEENKMLFARMCFGNLDQDGEVGLTCGEGWLLVPGVGKEAASSWRVLTVRAGFHLVKVVRRQQRLPGAFCAHVLL